MKRKIIGLLLIILSLSSVCYAEGGKLFKDTKEDDWFIRDVSYLVDLDGISGYPDGTFRPDKDIVKSEFIKTLVSSLGYSNLPKTNDHWASGYIDKALSLDLIGDENLLHMDRSISRYEMARIISNTLDYKREVIPALMEKYASNVKDIGEISDKILYYSVLKTYVKGIISGYPDGSFSGDNYLSRAEASTVIVRLIDENKRVKQVEDKKISFADEVLTLINIERVKEGLHELSFCEDLNSVANIKSKDMAIYNYFSHTSPNYGSLFDMLEKRDISYMAAGENIAMGQKTPKQVVDAWMNSPGHRKNILNPNYNKIGIGVYIGNSTYWTQAFTS